MKKNILLVLLALPLVLIAQTPTQTENYVLSTSYQKGFVKGLEWTATDQDKISSVAYLDGLGRPVQSVAVRAGGANEDIVTFMEYDMYGRQVKDYLPYATSTTGGTFRTNAYATTGSFYTAKYGSAANNPYSEKHFEASPLNRLHEQAAPGSAWLLNKTSDTDHTVKFDYQTNSANEVKKYTVSLSFVNNTNTYTPTLQGGSAYYAATQLYKTITKDENWTTADGKNRTTEEFKDKLGRVILKRVFADVGGNSTAHDTYYVYDDYGNLSYVLPPKAEPQTAKPDATELKELCYQYKYDDRNRLVEKKMPGTDGWESIVYNKLDQPVMTQDTKLDAQGKWLFTKYDILGRVAYHGFSNSGASRTAIQNAVNNSTQLWVTKGPAISLGGATSYYTNEAYPATVSEIISFNYYDDYTFDKNGLVIPSTSYGTPIVNYNNASNTKVLTRGLPTGSKVKVLGHNGKWITTVTGYDRKSRPIWIGTHNSYLQTTDIVENKLDDFTGRVLETKTTHKKTGKADIVTIDVFEYDHQGRVISQIQHINGSGGELIARNYYDDLGQLEKKDVGGSNLNGTNSTTFTDLVRITLTNDEIKRTAGSGWGGSGLATNESFSGNGYVEYETMASNNRLMVGLSNSNSNAHYNTIDYAIYQTTTGNLYVYESGSNKGYKSTYQTGDILRVERIGSTIYYKKNGNTFYTSTVASTGSLLGDISLYYTSDKIKNMNIVDNSQSLQTVDYKYNVRGWLTDINDVNNIGTDLFTFNVRYDNPASGAALYNGNISQTFWKTKNTDQSLRNYRYSYDALNRIESAIDNTGGQRYSLNNVDYDKNGNITRIDRRGAINTAGTSFGGMDVIFYTYYDGGKSNRLRWVVDYGNDDHGFVDGNPSGTDYWYDTNGNMTKDLNKGISNINYNHLNLPTQVTINGQNISYVYDAVGAKLQKTVNGTTTDYAGNYVYENGNLQYFNHAEGYVSPDGSSFKYIYQYKDHLGNIRLSYQDVNGDGSIATSEIIEENNYYPFGLKHKGYNTNVGAGGNSVANKFKYNGKELNEEFGLDWYDYGARNYDASLGRWFGVDELAEDYYSSSPYAFVGNNPMTNLEIDGRFWIRTVDENGTVTYTAQKGDSAWSLHQQFGEQDGLTAENANSLVVGILGENYIGEDGKLKSNVEVNDELKVYTDQESTEAESTPSENVVTNTQEESALAKLDRQVDGLGTIGKALYKLCCYNDAVSAANYYDRAKDDPEGAFNQMKLEGIASAYANAIPGLEGNLNVRSTRSRRSRGSTRTGKTSRRTVKVSGKTLNVKTGPRGGKYYINKNGNRTNLNRDGTKITRLKQ